jgi:hypothetical protein
MLQHYFSPRGREENWYHTHLRDRVPAIDGQQSYIIWGDGADFYCEPSYGCCE